MAPLSSRPRQSGEAHTTILKAIQEPTSMVWHGQRTEQYAQPTEQHAPTTEQPVQGYTAAEQPAQAIAS